MSLPFEASHCIVGNAKNYISQFTLSAGSSLYSFGVRHVCEFGKAEEKEGSLVFGYR